MPALARFDQQAQQPDGGGHGCGVRPRAAAELPEPQRASDVFAMYQSVLHNRQVVPEELFWKDTPENLKGNIDHLMDVIDWELNTDPEFVKHRFMAPRPVRPEEEMKADGYRAVWVTYLSDAFSAQELTGEPGRTVTIKDSAVVMLKHHGPGNPDREL